MPACTPGVVIPIKNSENARHQCQAIVDESECHWGYRCENTATAQLNIDGRAFDICSRCANVIVGRPSDETASVTLRHNDSVCYRFERGTSACTTTWEV